MIPLLVLGGAAALVGYIATRPDALTITRSRRIDAPPDRIFPHLNDFHKWEAWSPWEKLDPTMRKTHSGQPSGPGASYEWEGNNKVGSGRMDITNATAPTRVEIRLEFMKPWKAVNTTVFSLVPVGESTDVTWTMTGNRTFMMKAFGVVMDMDKLVGADFERGLDALKTVTESPA